ncbi:MAG: hypothetical protein E7Z87_02065 [Cyanobacteria bacterium SIG26]|nr:hypothetical protein [Cyanobacteria bacterium SIG26]
MLEFHPYFTNDGSVGLYSEGFDDIYHSSTGALTEAYEKFVQPIDINWLHTLDKIKVLDICYGIGYNTKTFLNFILEKNFSEKFSKILSHAKTDIAPIHTDKIQSLKELFYNETIYTNNILNKISITALDNDENLYFLSPYIKTGKNNLKTQKFDFESKNIEKYLKNKKNAKNPKINKIINFLIFQKILQYNAEITNNEGILRLLSDKKYKDFFEQDLVNLFKFYKIIKKLDGKNILIDNFTAFLHNIYYRYITKRYKKGLKTIHLVNLDFNYKNGDARTSILEDKNTYNLVFLDAFTPSKCPCLWSFDFFKLLYSKLDDNGMILTYSTSSAVRGAMQEAGFYIGNIFNSRLNKVTGTIATKKESLIKHSLSEFDLGLLKTTAGIFYRDENLTGLNEAIKTLRDSEVKNSTRMSTSKYKKLYKNKELPCNTM